MNQVSSATGTTDTSTVTIMLDDSSSGRASMFDSSSAASGSLHSRSTASDSRSPSTANNVNETGDSEHLVYNYKKREFEKFIVDALPMPLTCEEICISMLRAISVLPATRFLFGLRVFDSENKWALPGKPLVRGVRYCLRIRFKVPELDSKLPALDQNCHEYIYYQMRYDMLHEHIVEIRYPAKKDNVMGLAVVDMVVDMLELGHSVRQIEDEYENYLPRKLIKAHTFFAKRKIRRAFRRLSSSTQPLNRLKWHYVHEIYNLSPSYLMEQYKAMVDYLPENDFESPTFMGAAPPASMTNGYNDVGAGNNRIHVYLKLSLHDSPEPGLKIARVTSMDKLKWLLLAKFEDISMVIKESESNSLRLEINGYARGYLLRFEYLDDLKSFVTYLGGYVRLTTNWMLDLCMGYGTPSLLELKNLRCHGPIGGSFSFSKLCVNADGCGSHIIRQCEKEYDTYYIDINTRVVNGKYVTETFQIKREHNKWILNYDNRAIKFDQLTDLAQFIPIESTKSKERHKLFRIPPSDYEKSPQLLICLPKNFQTKKTEKELSDADLQRRCAQIFDPEKDLHIYENSYKPCDNFKMFTMRADWKQKGTFKDVPVTLKVLKKECSVNDFPEFMKLAHAWSVMYSPQFIKLYGLTLSTPYTMVMEYSEHGPLNTFLSKHKKVITMACLMDVMHGFVRGMYYLQHNRIIHPYIRCSNLYVTKYDQQRNELEAKIIDPGFPRKYDKDDLPWIPISYFKNMEAAKSDEHAQFWAFGTTVWEIFACGKPIQNYTAESLSLKYYQHGAILPLDDEQCPKEMHETMMDGWSSEPNKRFNHQSIFARLSAILDKISANYVEIGGGSSENATPETCSIDEQILKYNASNGISEADLHNFTFSGNSMTPLIANSGTGDSVGGDGGRTNRYPILANYFPSTPSVLQVPDGNIIYKEGDKIGEGHYGTVYRGEIQYFNPKKNREQVAIKKLKSYQMTMKLKVDFEREMKIMQALDHPNVVKFKYCIDEPISIIMEYFEYGSFTLYLKSHRPNLTNEQLLRFALDIAEGMDYLGSKDVIHRDLAARNILVDRDRVKISDFGLAQMADSDGYYIARSVREIPIKWYSPESIKTSKFSYQSDVWSYGVTLFEMFSRGEIPNLEVGRELTQDEFLRRLENGERLRQTPTCPDNVYNKLMRPCWHNNPKERPTFKQLIDAIKIERSRETERN